MVNNKNKKILTISLLSVPLSASIALVPVLSNIARAFPDKEHLVQLLITLPPLLMMFSSIFTNKLANKTSIKFVTILSIVIIFFSGLSPYWINNFNYLLLSRCLMGIGLGFLNTTIASLPALYFTDEKERDFATGVQAAFVSGGGIIFNLLSGFLAVFGWQYVFLAQLLNIIPLLISFFIMPKDEQVQNISEQHSAYKNIFVKNAIPIAILSFICVVLTVTYPLNLSLFVENQKLGTSNFVSRLTSLNSAIGFFIGLFFGKIYSKYKENTLSFGLTLTAIALFIVAFSSSEVNLLLGNIIFGIGSSLISPTLYALLYEKVAKNEIVPSVALLGIASNISQFVSPFVINPIANIISINSIESARFIVSSSFLVLVVIFLRIKSSYKKRI